MNVSRRPRPAASCSGAVVDPTAGSSRPRGFARNSFRRMNLKPAVHLSADGADCADEEAKGSNSNRSGAHSAGARRSWFKSLPICVLCAICGYNRRFWDEDFARRREGAKEDKGLLSPGAGGRYGDDLLVPVRSVGLGKSVDKPTAVFGFRSRVGIGASRVSLRKVRVWDGLVRARIGWPRGWRGGRVR